MRTLLLLSASLLSVRAAGALGPGPAASPTPDSPGTRVAAGVWGGPGIAVRVGESGAEIEFNCARGAIDGPIRVDAEGRFDVTGTYERGHPGPAREGDSPKASPARYRGTLEGDTLAFEVTLDGRAPPMGPYAARRGRPARVHPCL